MYWKMFGAYWKCTGILLSRNVRTLSCSFYTSLHRILHHIPFLGNNSSTSSILPRVIFSTSSTSQLFPLCKMDTESCVQLVCFKSFLTYHLFISTILGTNGLNSADLPLSNKQTNKQNLTYPFQSSSSKMWLFIAFTHPFPQQLHGFLSILTTYSVVILAHNN